MAVLSSLRVLDFTTILPGPFATMMLADMGAAVVHIEPATYTLPTREHPPFDHGVSSAHAFLNRSKRSLALNLKNPMAVEIVKRLVKTHDIVVEQFRPGVMDRLGIGYESLAQECPSVIYCSLTGYGQTGPLKDRAGHDNNYLSLAGVMSHSGRVDGGPVPQGVQVADIGCGSYSMVAGILAAVIHRQQTGEGQFVDVAMFDGAVFWNAYAAAHYFAGGDLPAYESMRLNGGSHYDYWKTKDGRYFSVGSLEPKFWEGFCKTLGREDLIEQRTDPGPAMAPVREEIRKEFAKKTFEEWKTIFGKVDFCVEPVLTLEETFRHPQTLARNMVVDVPRGDDGTQQQVGSPFKFSKSEPVYEHIGAALGEHNATILEEAGYTPQDIVAFEEEGIFGDPSGAKPAAPKNT